MDCLTAEIVLSFVTGRLGPDQISVVEEHTGGCAACLDLLVVAASKGDRAEANGGWPSSSLSLDLGRLAPPALPAGSTVGRYLLISLVGRGGMGEIYSAYDPELDRRVAIKLLNVEPASGGTTAQARARLLREAKAIARLSHPNVVVVFDAGTFGERMFIAMELVEGQSLSRWLEVRARSWREVRDVFLGAGRGLAAAHAAGLVHRDFKPQNVMVGWDGKARVADFGLVSGLPADAEAPGPGNPPNAAGLVREVEPSLTRTGTVIGTPLYMAPEQFRSEPADARSDQFSFAVALYEGLYGERPFPGETIASLRQAVLAGRMREAPVNRKVPAWLRRVVLRGLRIDREGRYPSMEPMIEALGRVPGRRRTRLVALMVLVAAVAGATAIAQRAALHPQRMCLGAADRLAGIWESNDAPEPRPRRTAIRQAFLTTGSREAADVWDRVSVGLDRYASRWRDAYTSSCEATHVSGEQSAEVLDLRMTCLRGRLAELKALTDIFASADSAVVGGAVQAVLSLGRIEPCADVALLRAVVPPPTDERTRAQVEALRNRLAVVQALRDSGRHRQGVTAAAALVTDARNVGYKPLLAEALFILGWLQSMAGDFLACERTLTEAVWVAEASHHDEIKARAAGMLAGEDGDAELWGRFAEATAERMGPGHELILAWVLTGRGNSSDRRGDHEAGARFARQALAIKRRILPPDDPDVGISLNNLSIALTGLGDYAAALAALDEALAIVKSTYGESSCFGEMYLSNRGETLNAQGRHNEARTLFESVVRRMQDRYAPDHRNLAHPLTGLGEAQLAMGEPEAAVVTLERALRIREHGEPDPLLVADTRFALARALWEAAGAASDRGRARTLAASARAAFAAPPGAAAKASAVDAWLARHPPGAPSPR